MEQYQARTEQNKIEMLRVKLDLHIYKNENQLTKDRHFDCKIKTKTLKKIKQFSTNQTTRFQAIPSDDFYDVATADNDRAD
jgi:hypothetical protein